MKPAIADWLNKVPEVTLSFWVIKILSTTVGETGADFLAVDAGFGAGPTSLGMAALRRAHRRRPGNRCARQGGPRKRLAQPVAVSDSVSGAVAGGWRSGAQDVPPDCHALGRHRPA
ncbi:hypothetical protein C6Y56_11795 [Pseudomonas fluorescens]|uniref:Uncharacterized protein n=1 Tax=Pseudomonas fluorescens TaxID=294 RepID=A0A7Z3C482_PSEFL|nr:hypothetical protein C6Y56_11795 [Pseudomonas fluorescens]